MLFNVTQLNFSHLLLVVVVVVVVLLVVPEVFRACACAAKRSKGRRRGLKVRGQTLVTSLG